MKTESDPKQPSTAQHRCRSRPCNANRIGVLGTTRTVFANSTAGRHDERPQTPGREAERSVLKHSPTAPDICVPSGKYRSPTLNLITVAMAVEPH